MEPSKIHYPHECKHCNADGVHCDKTIEPAGEHTWIYPCHLLEYPCPDFTSKTDKNDEHYISFEQATKLKKLGFDKKVNHGYSQKMRIEPDLSYGDVKEVHSKEPRNYNDNRKGIVKGIQFYSAPRLDQAQAWLREAKGWDVTSIPTLAEYGEKKYRWDVCHWSKPEYGDCSDGIFDTYESALSAGIDKALELLGKEEK